MCFVNWIIAFSDFGVMWVLPCVICKHPLVDVVLLIGWELNGNWYVGYNKKRLGRPKP